MKTYNEINDDFTKDLDDIIQPIVKPMLRDVGLRVGNLTKLSFLLEAEDTIDVFKKYGLGENFKIEFNLKYNNFNVNYLYKDMFYEPLSDNPWFFIDEDKTRRPCTLEFLREIVEQDDVRFDQKILKEKIDSLKDKSTLCYSV